MTETAPLAEKQDANSGQTVSAEAEEAEPTYPRDKTLFNVDDIRRKSTREMMKQSIEIGSDGKIRESKVKEYIKEGEKTKQKAKIYKRSILWLLFVVLLLIVGIVILAVVLAKKSQTLSKMEATKLMGAVMIEVVTSYNASNYSNFSLSIDETNNVKNVFDAFDTDVDGSLNIDEFTEYWSYISGNKNVFGVFDVNGDDILSYRETVLYLKTIHSIPAAKPVFEVVFAAAVELMYNYSYNEADPVFIEYAADVFFELFDLEYNGYVSRNDYVAASSRQAFDSQDANTDELISFEELVAATFYEAGISAVSKYVFGKSMSNYTTSISLNKSDVMGVELHKCPNYNLVTSDAAQSIRRRLGDLNPLSKAKCAKSLYQCGGEVASCITDCITDVNNCACLSSASSSCNTLKCIGCDCCEGYSCKTNIEDMFGDCDGIMDELECICFSEHGIVTVMDGTKKELKDVKVGDYVFDGDDYIKVIAVERLSHKKLKMITLYAFNYDDKTITLTGDHLLFNNNNELVAASNFQIGDILYGNYTVYDIKETEEWPATPITMSGKIYVNGFKASCYIGYEEFATVAHNLLGIFRWSSEYVSEYYTAKIVESLISDVVWIKNEIVERYALEWIFIKGTANPIYSGFIAVTGALLIYCKQALVGFISAL